MKSTKTIPWLLLLIGIGLLTSLPFWNLKGDDVFITFRYVENLVEHGQLAYNLGEPTYGFTSPVWLGIQSLFFLIVRNIFISSWVACFLSFIGCIVSLWLLAGQMIGSPRLRFFAVLVVLVDPWFMRWAFAGQEITFKTAISALMIWLTVVLLKRQAPPKLTTLLLAGFVFSLGFLTRPEIGLLILVCLIAFLYKRQVRSALVIGLVVFVLYGSWMIYCNTSFGEILPHTILVKTILLKNTLTWGDKAASIITYSLPRYGAIVILPVAGLFLVVMFLLFRIGKTQTINLIRSFFRSPAVMLSLIWVACVSAGYLVTGAYMVSMYTLLFSPFLPLLLFAMVEMVARDFPRFQLNRLVAAALLWAVIYCTGLLTFGRLGNFSWMVSSRYSAGDDIRYIQYAEWVNANLPEDARIATYELGIVGFYGNRYMIDLAGIATPGMINGNENELLKYSPTYFSLYGETVDRYGAFLLRPIRSTSFLRAGGANAIGNVEQVCVLYEVVGVEK
jgi:Dolichyl-phosphate-mannose-protein mannosyltransferase